MKKLLLLLSAAAASGICAPMAGARTVHDNPENVPERAIILSGDSVTAAHLQHIALIYSRENLAFEDPDAPRFLFLDKKGRAALGIGATLRAIGMYDFNGAISNNGFTTFDIPVPLNPAQRQRLGGTLSHSSIYLRLVTSPTRLGRIQVYFQTNFTGDNGGYGVKIKQAYVTLGNVTLGKARSTFSDAPAMAPTVDDQGPSGQVTAKPVMVQYRMPAYKGFSAAISAELPEATYTLGSESSKISQRFPDIPAYVQYAWDGGNSHIRLSGLLRELSYRDIRESKNHFETGWGVQVSGLSNIVGGLKVFGHYTYGKGISNFINDLSGQDLDLIPCDKPGEMKAPGAAGWTAGLRYDFTKDFFISGSYSQARLYDASAMSPDTYKYGQYVAVNAFYDIGDLRLGAEYLHGTRKNYSGESGHANRIEALVQYSF